MTARIRLLLLLPLLVVAALVPDRLAAQEPAPASTAPLAVYLDCQDGGCDFDFFRTDITFVNWVRDRQVADVHLLVSSQQTGSGGREYTVTFIGLRQYASLTDTLIYAQPPASTEDERRRGLARTFRAGLVRYLARTDAASRLTISLSGAAAPMQGTPQDDPWNSWVYRIGLFTWFNGDATYKTADLNGNLNADRITARWKTRIALNQSYSQNNFELDSVTTFVTIQRSYGGNLLHALSLNDHWSVGGRFNFGSSTYDNFLRSFRVFPAIEYNVFPYSQSTRRQVRFEYNLGYARFDYRDTTIFDRIREQMPLQRLIISASATERWGSADVRMITTSYLHDTDKFRIGGRGDLSWRIFKGFNLNVFGGYEYMKDQFYLAKRDFTPEQILTRQFRLPSNYYYYGSVGVSYTFGSILNNVVNPRFGPYFFD